MSFISTDFIFNDIKSTDMGLYQVHIETTFYGTPISGGKQMTMDKIPYRDKPFYYKTDLDLMQFTVTFSPLEGKWTDNFKFNIFKWLNVRTPQKFQTDDYLSKVCYCVCTNPQLVYTGGTDYGYITLEFQATTPYWLTDITTTEYDLSSIGATPTTVIVENRSNVENAKLGGFYYEPEIFIYLKGTSTSITLKNLSDGGRETSFTSLTALEEIYVNNELMQIQSSTGNNRLSNFNKNWLRLAYGQNRIQVNNPCIIRFQCQFPLYI